jgi:AcrR family transcriptional regulator
MEALGRLGPDTLEGTKRRIVKIAGDLFSERSYLGVSMSDIAKCLHITKPALYYHFASKMELYAEVLDDVVAQLRAVIAEAGHTEVPEKRLHQLVKSYLDFGVREKNLINALIGRLVPDDAELRTRIASFRQELADQVEPTIRETVAKWRLPKEIDGSCVTEMLMALMDGLLIEYSFLDKQIDSERVADQILAVLRLGDGHPASL